MHKCNFKILFDRLGIILSKAIKWPEFQYLAIFRPHPIQVLWGYSYCRDGDYIAHCVVWYDRLFTCILCHDCIRMCQNECSLSPPSLSLALSLFSLLIDKRNKGIKYLNLLKICLKIFGLFDWIRTCNVLI